MFSNKLYYLKFSISLAIILVTCLYSFLTLSFSKSLSDGADVVCKYRKVLEIGDDYFTYGRGARKTAVFGDISGIKRGDYVSFSAALLGDGNLKLKSFHIHKYRIYAMYLSVPPVIIVFLITVRRLKWSKNGLTLRP